jgi:hypothetical protein
MDEASGVHILLGCGPHITINYNNIAADYYDYGVSNYCDFSINAKNNWWGDPSGPDDDAGVINGSGDRISTNIDADPWLLQQSHVNIYEETQTTTKTGTADIQTDGGAITGFQSVSNPPSASRPNYNYPQGFFKFNVIGLSDGQTVTLTVTLPQAVPVGSKWIKYENGTYYVLNIGSDNGDNVITVDLTDGVTGQDADGEANGIIVDDGGPGYKKSPQQGVGGEIARINKTGLLVLWMGLASALVLVSLVGVRLAGRRKTN